MDSPAGPGIGSRLWQLLPENAIVRIARKLANRIFSILKTRKKYEYDRCC